MAPPPPSANASLGERLTRLATTLQFAWFLGHFTLLIAVFRYGLSYFTFNYYSKWAAFTYRLAFISAVATYGIVVFKAYRARVKTGDPVGRTAMLLLSDENVQYLRRYHNASKDDNWLTHSPVISLVWLYSRQVPLALLPFTVYSVFHVATYTRTNIIPTLSPPKAAPGSTPTSPGATKSQSPLANSIGRFVKEYYDSSMMLVAGLEILLWFRLLLSAFTFSKGSWVLLGIYTVFLRARFHQSQFVQGAFSRGSAHIDQQVQNPNFPPAARQGWETVKGLGRQVVDATDVRKYLGGATAQKKPQ
ncbi:Transmembrane nucleoporin [Exophiala xenobiotica]|nr:Transmembrane nucleoporin [Exophiala xenobiotica]KAK5264804.1 Transmembrane nucleoporin [Exophiala xenobiotica]KAK5337078.1 Transmembrane nucleoporin [Exophiala xenobiotica]KAK5420192.1 Transmembrane nucleoporin [Exophiala xenobiotica]